MKTLSNSTFNPEYISSQTWTIQVEDCVRLVQVLELFFLSTRDVCPVGRYEWWIGEAELLRIPRGCCRTGRRWLVPQSRPSGTGLQMSASGGCYGCGCGAAGLGCNHVGGGGGCGLADCN